jgi:hypothetical protein
MVEVASSNLAGPTKSLSLCFSLILFFVSSELSRVVASYIYLRKVALKKWHRLPTVALAQLNYSPICLLYLQSCHHPARHTLLYGIAMLRSSAVG